MKKCKSCKKEIDAKATKCPYCQTDQRNWFARHPILTIILILIVVGIFGSAGSNKNTTVKTTSNNSQSAQEAQAPTEIPDPNPHFSDGTYVVGKDIQPGTYRTRKASSGCYFARLSGFGGTLGEIISNENADHPSIVTIAETDKGFKSTRCGTWTQDLSAITTSKTTFEDGIYIIGTDIEPGTYQNSGASGCYYARLAGFTGSFSDIIANENVDAQAIVTIEATDKGFKSTRCGTWSKK